MGLASRPELVTPLSAPRRVAEGVFLHQSCNVSMYAGGVYNGPPILAVALSALLRLSVSPLVLRLLWVLVDVVGALAAFMLARACDDPEARKIDDAAIVYSGKDDAVNGTNIAGAGCILSTQNLPAAACAAYLLNPLTFAVWASGSSAAFTNAAVLWALALLASRARVAALRRLRSLPTLNHFAHVWLCPHGYVGVEMAF